MLTFKNNESMAKPNSKSKHKQVLDTENKLNKPPLSRSELIKLCQTDYSKQIDIMLNHARYDFVAKIGEQLIDYVTRIDDERDSRMAEEAKKIDLPPVNNEEAEEEEEFRETYIPPPTEQQYNSENNYFEEEEEPFEEEQFYQEEEKPQFLPEEEEDQHFQEEEEYFHEEEQQQYQEEEQQPQQEIKDDADWIQDELFLQDDFVPQDHHNVSEIEDPASGHSLSPNDEVPPSDEIIGDDFLGTFDISSEKVELDDDQELATDDIDDFEQNGFTIPRNGPAVSENESSDGFGGSFDAPAKISDIQLAGTDDFHISDTSPP